MIVRATHVRIALFSTALGLVAGCSTVGSVGDSVGGTIAAIETGDKTAANGAQVNVQNIDEKLAATVGVMPSDIMINDVAVNPIVKQGDLIPASEESFNHSARACVVGRSSVVGLPVALLLENVAGRAELALRRQDLRSQDQNLGVLRLEADGRVKDRRDFVPMPLGGRQSQVAEDQQLGQRYPGDQFNAA